MIQIEKISYRYPGSKHQVFEDFSLTLKEDNIYGLLGKNGSGKSTLLYLICGLLRPEKGTVYIDGVEAKSRSPYTLSDLFIVPEEFDLPNVTLASYVRMNKPFYPHFNQDVLDNCLRDFELPLSLKLKELSMGQKKKVYMSFALAAGTKILVMDEPTNGLDVPSKSQFRRVIANNMTDGRMLIVSTHQVHDVESLLDHIVIMDDKGLLLDASVADVCKQYVFTYRTPTDVQDDVVYSEPTPQGNAVIARRGEGDDETPVNLELLFNACVQGVI